MITAYPTEDPSSRLLLAACGRLGEALPIDPAALAIDSAGPIPEILAGGRSTASIDVFLLARGLGTTGDPDVQFEIYRALARLRPMLSPVDALLSAQDKLCTSLLLAAAGVPTPRAVVVQRQEELGAALELLGPAVAKPLCGSLGEGVEPLDPGKVGLGRGAALLAERGALYLQARIDHGGRDLRIFVVGDQVEAAVERRAPPGELRTNAALGGMVSRAALPAGVAVIALRAAQTLGLDWAGVDIAVSGGAPTVLEVNGTPGWEATCAATDRDMAEPIARLALRRALPSSIAGGRPAHGKRAGAGWR